MGNMVAIHNIVAVCSVLGLHNAEGAILRRTLTTMLVYGLVAAAVVALILPPGIDAGRPALPPQPAGTASPSGPHAQWIPPESTRLAGARRSGRRGRSMGRRFPA